MRQHRFYQIPDRLRTRDQWVVVGSEKNPIAPSDGWQQPENQLSITEARQRAVRLNASIAFCFNDNGPFVGVDLDKVRGEDGFSDEALDIVQRIDSYSERSRSNTGLHIIAEGELCGDYGDSNALDDIGSIEMYDAGQYFIITADVLNEQSRINSRPKVVKEVQEKYLPLKSASKVDDVDVTTADLEESDTLPDDITPERVRRTIEAYIGKEGQNVDPRIMKLWKGKDLQHSYSQKADVAFFGQLYFWCKGDQRLMEHCYRKSDRAAPREDAPENSASAYRRRLIREVCNDNQKLFRGDYVN